MTRTPVTLADQAVVLGPEDADELTDLLLDASWVIGHLASLPAAEDASATAPAGPGSCADLALTSSSPQPPWTTPPRPAATTPT